MGSLFAQMPPAVGSNMQRVETKSGEEYWYGDALNSMLIPTTDTDGNRCVWSVAVSSALDAGLQPDAIPSLNEMFKHVATTVGDANEGRSSVPAEHQAQLPARDLLEMVWPMAHACFS